MTYDYSVDYDSSTQLHYTYIYANNELRFSSIETSARAAYDRIHWWRVKVQPLFEEAISEVQ